VANESNDADKTQAAPEESTPRGVATPSISVWARIREHKIAQWTLAYAAAAYALLDGTKIVGEAFDWPHQVLRIVTVLLIVGLPLVVTLAWYHGHRALHRVSGPELTLIAVLLVMAGAVLWHFARTPESTASTAVTMVHAPPVRERPVVAAPAKGSIAVLPFVDMSEKHDQEYFSDGLSEELIDHLTHFPDLKVIARTSSFAFKGKNEDMRSIAMKLGVANLLEGSVRKAGGELRITAQLIRALDGVHLWSETYDRKLTDIFKTQDEISATVAKALNAALNAGSSTEGQANAKGTTNIEAYNLFLQGNFYFWRSNSGDDAKAVELLQQAVSLDPRYAVAWARLARVYAWQGLAGELTAAEAEVRARGAVQRALAIDPNSAEAFYAHGNIFLEVVGDWKAAKLDYKRAAALDPHGEIGERAQLVISLMKASMDGTFGELIDRERRYLERNPLDVDDLSNLAWYQQVNGQLAESAATSRKLLELNPAYSSGQAQYGLTLLQMGKKSEALEAVQKESDDASKFVALACVYWAMDRRAESDSALGALEREFEDRNAYGIALVHAYRGEPDAAFAWLGRAYKHVPGSLAGVKYDPLLRDLHRDPRFDALLRKVKLME
jgi:TolB-like protein